MSLKNSVFATLAFALVILNLVAAQTPAPTAADQFYSAIRSGNIGQVQALIQSGADVNVKDRRGGATPLMHAAAIGSLETMKLLLDKGADVNARSAGGATPLMWAATDLAKIRLLLDRGADVNAVSSRGRGVLLLAAMSDGSAEIVRLLLSRGADPRAVDAEKLTTLLGATIGNDTDTIRQLIAAGVDVNGAESESRQTPLMVAATAGNTEAVKLLLAKGANVNAVAGEPSGQVKNGIIQLGRFTPLLLASTLGPPEVLKALLAAGADVNVKEARGMTPLMLSVTSDYGDVENVRTLLASKPDLQAKSLDGETALDWARKSGSTSFVAALTQAGAIGKPPAPLTVAEPAPRLLRPAVERGVALLERASGTFFVNGACGACHAQNVTDFATMSARRHGLPMNDSAAAQRAAGAAAAFGATAPALIERNDGPAVDIFLYTLAGLAEASYPPDRATDAIMINVVAQQLRDGRWHIGGIARPPIEDGDFSRTALGVRALKVYALPGRGPEMTDRLRKAVGWLRATKPITTEDRSFRLLGLAWGGENAAVLREAANDLVATQRADGGWAQRTEMTSDPYATGLSMYALRESGALANTDPAIEKSTKYLLSTQRADGSWFVRSRSPKFQPYFESGFPYGHDQWISSMATGWATAALATVSP